MNRDWIDNLYNEIFSKVDITQITSTLKENGVWYMKNVFTDDRLKAIVKEIRKALSSLGIDTTEQKIPKKVRGIIKLGFGFANEPIFWYLRVVLNVLMERFLGTKLNLASFDTMNETFGNSTMRKNPHVDVLFGEYKTENLQCLFQFYAKEDANDNDDDDDGYTVLGCEDDSIPTDMAGFSYYKGSHLPSIRSNLQQKFKKLIPDGTWELPNKDKVEANAILNYLEKYLDCENSRITFNNCLVIFDGALVHYAGNPKFESKEAKKKNEHLVRYAVYASIKTAYEVPETDMQKRINWLFNLGGNSSGKGTGHQIKDPQFPAIRVYENEMEAYEIIKNGYGKRPKVLLTSFQKKLVFSDDGKIVNFDFNAFGIKDKTVFEEEISKLSGVTFLAMNSEKKKNMINNDKLEAKTVVNQLVDYNEFKKNNLLKRKRMIEEEDSDSDSDSDE